MRRFQMYRRDQAAMVNHGPDMESLNNFKHGVLFEDGSDWEKHIHMEAFLKKLKKKPLIAESGIKRPGHKSFAGLVWQLIKVNLNCRRHNFKCKYEFKFPLRWM